SGYLDATSAYGYGGPWIEGTPNLLKFKGYLDSWAAQNNVVTTFLRFHPLLNNANALSAVLPTIYAGPTAGWDLQTADDLVSAMSKNHRKSWRRAVRAGVEARVTPYPYDVESFQNIYETSMNRLSADSFYWFTEEYWDSLRDELSGSSLLVEAL